MRVCLWEIYLLLCTASLQSFIVDHGLSLGIAYEQLGFLFYKLKRDTSNIKKKEARAKGGGCSSWSGGPFPVCTSLVVIVDRHRSSFAGKVT